LVAADLEENIFIEHVCTLRSLGNVN